MARVLAYLLWDVFLLWPFCGFAFILQEVYYECRYVIVPLSPHCSVAISEVVYLCLIKISSTTLQVYCYI